MQGYLDMTEGVKEEFQQNYVGAPRKSEVPALLPAL